MFHPKPSLGSIEEIEYVIKYVSKKNVSAEKETIKKWSRSILPGIIV